MARALIAAKFLIVFRGKSEQANFRSDWTNFISQIELDGYRIVEHEKGAFLLVLINGVVFFPIIGGDSDLQWGDFLRIPPVGEHHYCALTTVPNEVARLRRENDFKDVK